MDQTTVKILIQEFHLIDPALADRARDYALELLALLLIVDSAAQIDLGFTQAIALELSMQDRIHEVIKACWKTQRLAIGASSRAR